jgi:chromosome segregation ATPase
MNEIDLTLFGERMKQLLADTRAIKYDMSGLRAQFSALEARFGGLETRLNAVEVRLEHLDTLVDRMTDRMEAVQRGQAALEHRFNAMEALLREALGR